MTESPKWLLLSMLLLPHFYQSSVSTSLDGTQVLEEESV